MFEQFVDDPIETAKLIEFIKTNTHILNDFTCKLTRFVHDLMLDDQKN